MRQLAVLAGDGLTEPLLPVVVECQQGHSDAQQGQSHYGGDEYDALVALHDGTLAVPVAVVDVGVAGTLCLLEGTLGNDGIVGLVLPTAPPGSLQFEVKRPTVQSVKSDCSAVLGGRNFV